MSVRSVVAAGAVAVLLAGCGSSPAHHGAQSSAPPSVRQSVPVARVVAGLPFPVPGTGALPAAEVTRLRALVVSAADPALANDLPGVTVAVVTPSGSWSFATGRDGGGIPLQPDSTMAVGSISKTFTAAEVLLLAAHGRLDLDAPLSRYVSSPLLIEGPTVRQALGMLSGITDGSDGDLWYSNLLARARSDENVSVGPAASVAFDHAAPSTPGVRQVYSDVNFLLLAQAVERVTHEPFATLLRHDLLAPAGLGRVAVQDADRPVPPLAYPVASTTGAPLRDGYLPDRAMSSAALGCGSLAADAPSIARWGYEVYGARLLPAAAIDAMTTPQLTRTFGYGIGYGLGTVVYDRTLGSARGELVGHDGLITRPLPDGTSAGYQTYLVVDLAHRFSLAVFVPSAAQNTQEIALVAELVTALQRSG